MATLRDVYASDFRETMEVKAEVMRAEAWIALLSDRDYKELRVMLIEVPVKSDEDEAKGIMTEDDVIKDWIEDHGGDREWLGMLYVGYPLPRSLIR